MAVLFHLLVGADAGGERMSVLIRGVRPYGEGERVDVLVGDGQIVARSGRSCSRSPDDADVIDATGQVLLPGFVDLHTHLREPGREYAEDIETGSAAAALGGYTAVFAMANTDPVADSPVVTDHVWRRGQQVGLVDVHPVGAVTVGLAGEQLTEMGMMAAGPAQVRMFSDDGLCVHDPLVMRRALEYATGLGVLIAQHAEEPRLTVGRVAHEGPNAARLGLAGWPRAAEESIVARDALLARDAGARVHICHASTAGTVEILKWAKAARYFDHRRGHPAPPAARRHARWPATTACNRVNPPLREAADAAALRAGAGRRGDRLCGHRPRPARRAREGLRVRGRPARACWACRPRCRWSSQTMVETGLLDWRGVARVMSENPARIVGLADQGRPLEVGEPANLVVVDPDGTWMVARRRAGQPVGQHALRGDDAARDGDRDAAARDGDGAGREEPGMNSARRWSDRSICRGRARGA